VLNTPVRSCCRTTVYTVPSEKLWATFASAYAP
jgi:hypothetical protein